MSRLQKINPDAFNEFHKLIDGYKAEFKTAKSLAPFAPKTAGAGVSSVDALKAEVKEKDLIHSFFKRYYKIGANLYSEGKEIDGKTLAEITNMEENTQDLEIVL